MWDVFQMKKETLSKSVCPDLAKIRHFGNFLRVNLIFGFLVFNLLWQNFEVIKKIIYVENGQILKNNLVIW